MQPKHKKHKGPKKTLIATDRGQLSCQPSFALAVVMLRRSPKKRSPMSIRLIAFVLLTLTCLALGYPPASEAEQEKYAKAVAWCEVVKIDLLEQPRIELGLSSQMRRYTLRVSEVVRGEVKVGATFSLDFAHYEVLSADQIKNIAGPEILIWEIHRRPELKVGIEYRVYLGQRGDSFAPLEGRWSMITSRVPKSLYERWVGRKEEVMK